MEKIRELLEQNRGRQFELYEKNINPQFVKVLRTIGFDKKYVRAEGPYLFDAEGTSYLDFLSGYGAYNIGRNHPRLKAALHEALDEDFASMVQMDAPLLAGLLAEQLLKRAPHLQRVFFTNSGTEAVEGSLKFARAATGRNRILYLDHAFHGLTLGSLSANGNGEFRNGFGELLPGTPILMNDLETLRVELKKGDVAAFIYEPIQGKGVHLPADGFLQEAQKLCRQYGTLTIADEVQAGLGRTGKFFAFEHWGLSPDIIALSKSLSGGFIPVGAILYRSEIYEKIYSGMERCVVHSNTFGRGALAMVAGLTTLDVIENEKLVERSAETGNYLLGKLNALAEKFEMFGEARGKGLMIGIEYKKPKSLKLKAAWAAIHAANKGLFGQMIVVPLMSRHHILTQVAGHNIDLVKILPPLIISQSHADTFVEAISQVTGECHKFPGASWEVGMMLAKQAIKAGRAA